MLLWSTLYNVWLIQKRYKLNGCYASKVRRSRDISKLSRRKKKDISELAKLQPFNLMGVHVNSYLVMSHELARTAAHRRGRHQKMGENVSVTQRNTDAAQVVFLSQWHALLVISLS